MNDIGCEYSHYQIDCPHMRKVDSDNDCEYYKCEKCGETIEAYYEDMA